MPRIVVITHEHDSFVKRPLFGGAPSSGYTAFPLVEEMRSRGHSWTVSNGISTRPAGDVAILHINTTMTPSNYAEYGATFPLCINLAASDISKRHISQALVQRGDGWTGPVIVKSTLNHGGFPERRVNRRAFWKGKRAHYPGVRVVRNYPVFERADEVPHSLFDDDSLVIERFMPEPVDDGFAIRHWLFCGDYDFCRRFVASEKLAKASNIFRSEPVPVPEDLRLRREELGFDFGKFDFVVHEGKSYLLDANKTPGKIPSSGTVVSVPGLADGLEAMMRKVM